jgi:hypothetical protein
MRVEVCGWGVRVGCAGGVCGCGFAGGNVRLRVCGLECAGLGRFAGGGVRVGVCGWGVRVCGCGWGCVGGGVGVCVCMSSRTYIYIYIYRERESAAVMRGCHFFLCSHQC